MGPRSIGGTILLVEDNPDHEALALRKHSLVGPMNVRVARDGAEALDTLFPPAESPAFLPELILLDLKLPKVDGLEVLQRVRQAESTRLVPVVVLTSSDEERDVLSSYRLGANSYIRKPVDYEQFTDAARQIGTYWLSLNESPVRRP